MQAVLLSVRAGLKPGGVILFNLTGEKDSWVLDGKTTNFVTEGDAKALEVGWHPLIPSLNREYDEDTGEHRHSWVFFFQKP